ncbi:hypothetical protein QU600_001958 [Orientia tsutsugamushi]|uniref:hypothetical protein n=1 Tax=Orientia tsutsugamushi TaxID=784 RepID=UPI00315E01A8
MLEKALELKGGIAKEINPMEERRKESRELKQKIDKQITFEKAYERYINEHSKINNKKSWQGTALRIRKYAKSFSQKNIANILREDIQEVFNYITEKKYYRSANNFLKLLSYI